MPEICRAAPWCNPAEHTARACRERNHHPVISHGPSGAGAKEIGMYSVFFAYRLKKKTFRFNNSLTKTFRFNQWFDIFTKIYRAGTSRLCKFRRRNKAFKNRMRAQREKFNALLAAYRNLDESRFNTDTKFPMFSLTKAFGNCLTNASTGWAFSTKPGHDLRIISNRRSLIETFLTKFKDFAGIDEAIWKVFLDAVEAQKSSNVTVAKPPTMVRKPIAPKAKKVSREPGLPIIASL